MGLGILGCRSGWVWEYLWRVYLYGLSLSGLFYSVSCSLLFLLLLFLLLRLLHLYLLLFLLFFFLLIFFLFFLFNVDRFPEGSISNLVLDLFLNFIDHFRCIFDPEATTSNSPIFIAPIFLLRFVFGFPEINFK